MAKIITIDKEGHFVMMKIPVYQKDVRIINIYSLNNRTPKFLMEKKIFKSPYLLSA